MHNEWRGFIHESKSFMNYENRTFLQRIHFWLQVPAAYLRFRRA